jgi:hypothetical protein
MFMGVTPLTPSGERCTRRLSPAFLIDLQMIYKVSSGVSVDSIKKVAANHRQLATEMTGQMTKAKKKWRPLPIIRAIRQLLFTQG